MNSQRTGGMTFAEILIGLLLISLVMLSLLTVLQQSERRADDAYFDFIAMALAQEPLEVYRSFGFDWIRDQENAGWPLPLPFPRTTVDITDPKDLPGFYPSLAYECRRSVDFLPVLNQNGHTIGYKIYVYITPKEDSRLKQWFSRRSSSYSLSALVLRQPK